MRDTCTATEIHRNLEQIFTSFEDVIPKTTIKELKILQEKHIHCLASIPKGFGTNRNEALHRELNNFFSDKRIMTIDVAEALLTTFLYTRQFRNLPLGDRPAILLDKS